MTDKIDILEMTRSPVHPGEVLAEDFLEPLGISQSDFARRIGISFQRLNDILHARRGISVDTALRLARALGVSAQFWMNLQGSYDLWQAAHGKEAQAIAAIEPITA